MRSNIKTFFAILLLTFAIVSCGPAAVVEVEEIKTEIVLVDGLGREIVLEEPVTSVISLAPSNTEILYAVGAGDTVLARDSFSDYPEDALNLPDIGGGFAEYDLEQIVNLDPDLVLAAEINTAELVQSIEDLGIPVFYLSNPVEIENLYTNIQYVGILTGNEEKADELVLNLRERVEVVVDGVAQTENIPAVFYELDATDPTKPFTPGPDTFYSTLIRIAGGRNVGDALTGAWAQISLEELILQDPNIILLGDAMWGITPESVAEREGWSTLTAVSEGNVLPFDDNLMARPGPRLIDGLEALAKVLHPEIFN